MKPLSTLLALGLVCALSACAAGGQLKKPNLDPLGVNLSNLEQSLDRSEEIAREIERKAAELENHSHE